MAPTEIWKMLPFATEIGWPVNEPNHQRRGVPAESQISTPTMDQVPPELLVHCSADVPGPVVAPADATATFRRSCSQCR
jgi:hypothetical protein